MIAIRDPEHEDSWLIHSGTTAEGQWLDAPTLDGVHRRVTCHPHPCAIHKPSAHPLRLAPLHWDDGAQRMDRLCPHDLLHPDPDSVSHSRRNGQRVSTSHDCDGCCETPQKIY